MSKSYITRSSWVDLFSVWIGLDRIVKYQYTPDTDWIGLRFSGLDRTGF